MMRLIRLSAVLLLAAAVLPAPPRLAGAQPQKKPAPPGAGGVLSDERGKFRAYLDGQAVGTEDFALLRSGSEWICRGTSEVSIPGGGKEGVTAELRLASDGSPVSYTWNTKGQKKVTGEARFAGSTVSMQVRAEGGQPFTQEFQFETGKIIVLDNNLYHHYLLLARLYDWNARGAQVFSVLIPQDLTPGTVTAEWTGPQEVGGAKYETLRVKSADVELTLYISAGKLARIAVPDSKVEVVRE
jgi:hypothetical protein